MWQLAGAFLSLSKSPDLDSGYDKYRFLWRQSEWFKQMTYKRAWQKKCMTEQISIHNRHSAQWYFVINTLSSTKLVAKSLKYPCRYRGKKQTTTFWLVAKPWHFCVSPSFQITGGFPKPHQWFILPSFLG